MSNLEQKVQQRLDQATSEKDGVVGAVFAAVDRTGKVLVHAASGEAEKGSGRPMKLDTVVALYSCTKMIAGLAVMQLVEQDILKLDDADMVAKHLPEVANAKLLDGSAPKNCITLRHLLTHTAGFGYSFFNPEIKKWAHEQGFDDEFEFDGGDASFKQPLLFEPGTDWNYGVNIDWAGELLHRVTGQTLGDYCKQNIFDPLGADSISFGLLPEHKGRLSSMHQRASDGSMSVREHAKMTTQGASFHSGGAGAIGTIADYLKIMTVLINGGVGANGHRIVSEATLSEMLKDQLPGIIGSDKKPLDRVIQAASPALTNEIQMMPGVDKGWGITFQITKNDIPTGRMANSVWWAGLPNNYWVADPTSGIAHMILTQSFPFNDMKVLVPWLDCEAAVYSSLA